MLNTPLFKLDEVLYHHLGDLCQKKIKRRLTALTEKPWYLYEMVTQNTFRTHEEKKKSDM